MTVKNTAYWSGSAAAEN